MTKCAILQIRAIIRRRCAMAEKKIGIIVPHIVTNVDRELLKGAFRVLKEYGCDLVIITGISNFSENLENQSFICGRNNIFDIIRYGDFAGFLFAASWFTSRELKDRIYSYLNERELPCLVIEEENSFFPCIFPEERSCERELTDHLIKAHGCRRLYFISGTEHDRISQERLEGFKQGLADNGIEFDESCVFYGDFWKEKPYELGISIARGEVEKPDGVVCASDTMALCFMDGLTQNGMRVPEDVRVVGNDGKTECLLHTPMLTTVSGRNYRLGAEVAKRLLEMTGEKVGSGADIQERIDFRGSCGCADVFKNIPEDVMNELCRNNIMYNERYTSMVTDFIEEVVNRKELEELMLQVARFSYRLPKWQDMVLCLCEDWHVDFADISDFRKSGFSDRMLAALAKTDRLGECSICREFIDTAQLFPQEVSTHEARTWLLTSLFSGEQIFGYIATSYADPDDIFLDESYCMWCDTVSYGLRDTQANMYEHYVRHQISKHADIDPETGMLSMKGFRTLLSEQLAEKKKYIIQVIAAEDDIQAHSEINYISMLSVAVRRSSVKDEISARYGKNSFVIGYPCGEDISERRMMYQRLDEIENELLQYESDKLHFELPKLTTAATIISDINSLEDTIHKELSDIVGNANRKDDYSSQLIDIRRRIRRAPEKQWSVTMLSDMLHISRTHLQRMYSKVFDINCGEDIINIRIQKAKRLLKNTSLHISEVAYECGYENVSHFIRQFHDKVGVTATAYRKDNR